MAMMSSLCRGCAVVMLFAASGMCATSPMGDVAGHSRHGLKKDAAAAFMQAGALMPNLAISRGRALSHKPVQRMAPALRMSSDDKKEDALQKLASLDSVAEKKPEPDDGDESRKGFVEEIVDWFKSDEGREEAIQWTLTFGMALSFRLFIIEPRFIPSLSMFPTFEVGDQLAVDKISKYWREYERRDVVVFRAPPAFARFVDEQKANEDLIKRIVAVEGDTVQVKGGDLYINGEKQIEPYRNEPARYDWGPKKVPPGSVLVFGDNRNASLDSHIWGFLPKENIIGRAVVKYWPPQRAGGVEGAPPPIAQK